MGDWNFNTTFTVLGVDVLPFVPLPVIGLTVSTTVSENVSVVGLTGGVNVGWAACVSDKLTAVPAVCDQVYEIG